MTLPIHRLCVLGSFCHHCRARTPEGAEFREVFKGEFGGDSEFSCPYGVAWNSKQLDGPAVPLGDRIAAYLARLGIHKADGCGCDGRQAWLNSHEARILRFVYGVAWFGVAILLLGLGALAVWIA